MCLAAFNGPGITGGVGRLAKAQELLMQGHTYLIYLDGNGDGEACEGLR